MQIPLLVVNSTRNSLATPSHFFPESFGLKKYAPHDIHRRMKSFFIMVEIQSCLFAKIIWIIIKFRRIWNFQTLDLYKFCCAVEPPMLCFVRYRADEILWNLTTLRLLEWSWSSWYNFHVYTTVKRETYKHVFRYLEIKISVLILILDGLNTALRKEIGLSETMNRWNFRSMHQKTWKQLFKREMRFIYLRDYKHSYTCDLYIQNDNARDL